MKKETLRKRKEKKIKDFLTKEEVKEAKKTLLEKTKIDDLIIAYNKKYISEMKKSLLTAIIAGFSFLMALSWREVISEYVNKLVDISPFQGSLISSFIVTLVSVLGIMAATNILSEKKEKD